MRELVQQGAVVKPQLPLFLTSWVDKTSAQCMYTMSQTRVWSVSHLKAGCWYIECGKAICPVEEEVVKIACDRADSQVGEAQSTHVEGAEEENEVDISLLSEKERNQRERVEQRAKVKADREAQKVKDKEERDAKREAKKGGRLGKSKVGDASTPKLVLPEASIGSMSQNPRKRDSSFVELSASRLQQCTSPAFQDCSGGTLHLDELFLSTSLEATVTYLEEHNAFPKEWLDLQGFLQKVFLVSFFSLLHVVIAKVLK